jgi:Ca2+-binding RTX toxin-like protein
VGLFAVGGWIARILTCLEGKKIVGRRQVSQMQGSRVSSAIGVLAVACFLVLVAPSFAKAGTAQIVDPDPGPPHLTFTAASGEANRVLLLFGFGGYRLVDTGAPITAGTGCTQVNSSEVFCGFILTEERPTLDILLGDLNDFASVSPTVSTETTVDGEGGADDLEVGFGCVSEEVVCELLLRGGPGDDTLRALGTGVLDGGPGGDTMSGSGAEIDYRSRVNPVIVDGDGVADDGEIGEGDNVSADVFRVLGGSASDTFTNVDAFGRGGNDTCISTEFPFGSFCLGGLGDDVFIGGAGEESFLGGPGDDQLNGGRRSDDLEGGGGADTIRGGPGRDFLFGEGGNDIVVGGDGREFEVSGGSGDDVLRTRDGNGERVNGGLGFDKARVDGLDVVISIEAFF